MAATVRIFYHQGFTLLGGSDQRVLHQPHLNSDWLECDTVTPAVTHGSNAVPGACIASVEVQPGKAVYCEINSPNMDRIASDRSPMISGKTLFPCGPGWTFSFLEAQI